MPMHKKKSTQEIICFLGISAIVLVVTVVPFVVSAHLKAASELQDAFTSHVQGVPSTPNVHVVMKLGQSRWLKSASGVTPLMFFAAAGDDLKIRQLVKQGCGVNDQNMVGRSSLHLAASAGTVETCKLLLSYGASLELKDSYGETPLDYALAGGNPQVAHYLLQRTDFSSSDLSVQGRAIKSAVRSGDPGIVALLCKAVAEGGAGFARSDLDAGRRIARRIANSRRVSNGRRQRHKAILTILDGRSHGFASQSKARGR